MSTETLKWGLFSIAVGGTDVTEHLLANNLQHTIKFVNDDAKSVHGSLKVGSIYTSESGEWKLGGFEVLSSMNDDEAIIYVSCHIFAQVVTDSIELW